MVKVIWHKAASPPQMDGSIVFARWRQYAFAWGSQPNGKLTGSAILHSSQQKVRILLQWAPLSPKIALTHWGSGAHLTQFLGLIRAHNPNGISIGSAVFAGLTSVTDTQTTLRYSVVNNRPHPKLLSFKIYENLYWILFSLLSFKFRRTNLSKSLQWNFYRICCCLRGFNTTTQFLRSLVNFLHASERTPQNNHNSVITNCTPFTKPRYIIVKTEHSTRVIRTTTAAWWF